MGTQSILNAPRHRTKLAGQALTNDRIDLRFLPEFGCHWTRLRVSVKGEWIDFLKPVADGDALLDRPTGQGSYIVAPWSHRIPGGTFAFAGKRYEVQPNLEDGSAIHGDVRLRPWETLQADSQSFEARLETQRFEDFNYPFSLVFSHRMELDGEQLRVTFKTENVDREPVPVGVGFHPHFLRRPTGCDEDVLLRIAADRVYPLQNNLPIGFYREARYEPGVVEMEPGSRLYVYSDGLTDALNNDGEAFGRERLLGYISEAREAPLRLSLRYLMDRIHAWSRHYRLEDDVSMLAVEFSDPTE